MSAYTQTFLAKVQTVPRAEHYALQALVCKLALKSVVECVTDHQPLWKRFYSAKAAVKKIISYDLLNTNLFLIAEKTFTVKTRWMPSHLKTDTVDLPSGVSVIDTYRRDLADKYVKIAAERCCVDLNSSIIVLF